MKHRMSRAIDAVELKISIAYSNILEDGKSLDQIIDEQPTIEPERKKGKWINHRYDDDHHIADCDQCGHSLQWFDDDIPKYCCECGADMRGKK